MSESSGHLELSHAENCKPSDNKGLSEKHETNLNNTVATPVDPEDSDNCCETNTFVFNRNADKDSITVQHNNIEPSDIGHSHTLLDYHNNELTRRDLDSCCSESDTEESEHICEDFDVHFVSDIDEGRSKGSYIIKGSDKEADSAHLEPSSRDISDSFQVKKHKETDTQQPGEILIEQKMEPPALLKEKVPRKATEQNNHSPVDENNISFEESLNESLASDNTSQSTLPSDLSPPPLEVVSGETSVMRNHSEKNSENTNSKLIKPNDLSITAAMRNLRLENFTIKSYMQKEDLFSSELQNFKSAKKYLECDENPIRNYLEKPFLRVPDKENLQETDSGENRFQVHKSDSFHCQDINSKSETKPKLLGCERAKPFQEETSPIIMTPQNNKIVFSGEGSVRGIKGKVRIRCLAIDDQNIFNGKTNSMMDLSQQTVMEADERYDDNQQTVFLERFRRARSQVDVSQSSSDQELKLSDLQNVGSTELGIFKASSDQQNELQDEYQNLQNQLLSYQKKMPANQELLPKENIMSKFSLPRLTKSQVFFKEQLSSFDTEELKSETLPKEKPCSVSAAKNIHNSTFNLQSRIHSASLTSAKTKQFDSFKNPIKKDLSHSRMTAEFQPATDSEKPKVISHENEQETRKKTNNLISNKSPWLSLKSQAENEDISLKRFYKNLEENSYKPSNKSNKQATIIGNVAYRTKSLNVGKESNYFKQDERFFKEPISQNIEQPEVAQSFKNIFAPQPYKSKPISSTFRLPPAKLLGAPIVRGFSEEAKSKILESVKSSSVKGTVSRDTVADSSKEETTTNEEIALSPLQQNHVFQPQNTGVGTNSAKSFTDRVNTGAPIFPQKHFSQTNGISSTGNTQVNRFSSQNFNKEGSESKKLQNVNTRDELLMEIKKFGGQNSLKKVPPRHPSWQLKVFGSSSTE
ncbi:uncharacterized protein LOC143234242 [Tachypleus tridentatus]|uniref:uncharacterized protein LOC143234242 n=1 Tax=Tachypleus tridentatus TaxID=6853 RepID=UPI003FD3F60F